MALLAFAIVAGLSVVIYRSSQQQRRLARLVVVRKTNLTLGEIEQCLGPLAPGKNSWRFLGDVGGDTYADQNAGMGRVIYIKDLGTYRIVQVTTFRGRPLIEHEQTVVGQCLRH